MPPKGQRATERPIMWTPSADATVLRLEIFASFNSWPSADQVLVKLLFRIAARLHEMYVLHKAAWMAAPPLNQVYVAPTAIEMNNMVTDGHDLPMKAIIDAILVVMQARYSKDKCTTIAQKEGPEGSGPTCGNTTCFQHATVVTP